MQLHLSDEQLKILVDLVDSRLKEIHPEIRRSRLCSIRDELKHDLESLQELHEYLRVAQTRQAWEGYIQTRKKVLSNPPPGA